MKKWITLLIALLLAGNLSLTALADENVLSMSDASGQEGDTVYLAVSLNEPVQGNTIGITYAYDDTLLLALPESCSWSIKGLMKDFDANNAGVWASGNTQDLFGTICVLAFQLKAPLVSGTIVSCTVIIKDNSTNVGTYTAEAAVSTSCDHQYTEWADNSAIGHSRTCSLCGEPQTQSHTWDDGVLSDNPNNPFSQLKTYTCNVCGGTKSVEVFVQKEEELMVPTFPEETTPTAPKPTVPAQQQTDPTRPTASTITKPQDSQLETRPPYRDYNEPEDSQQKPQNQKNQQSQQSQQDFHVHADGSVHYGDHEENASPTVTSNPAVEATETTPDHTHEPQPLVTKETRRSNMILSAVVICLMFAAGALYLKKKNKL